MKIIVKNKVYETVDEKFRYYDDLIELQLMMMENQFHTIQDYL